MTCDQKSSRVLVWMGAALAAVLPGPALQAFGQAPAAAETSFTTYAAGVEARLRRQYLDGGEPLAGEDARNGFPPVEAQRLHGGEPWLEELTSAGGLAMPGALLHHWRATAFVPGGTAAGFEALLRHFKEYPDCFAPEVLAAGPAGNTGGEQTEMWMRVRQRHGLTVEMEGRYEVQFGHPEGDRGWSWSRSRRLDELANGQPLTPAESHGFLWRQNTYWSWEERDGGLYLQVESISLSRAIPRGLGWLVGPYVESIPRESLAFTLRAACRWLRRDRLTAH